LSLRGSGGWEGAGCLQKLSFHLNKKITILWEISFSSRLRDEYTFNDLKEKVEQILLKTLAT